MKRWMYILILLLAFMLVLPPAAAYVSIKQTPMEADGEEPYPETRGENGYGAQVTFMQASLVGWDIYWYNRWGDLMGSAADWELPVTDYAPLYMSDHCDWTVSTDNIPGYIPIDGEEFPLDRGYQTWVTIVPEINKFGALFT